MARKLFLCSLFFSNSLAFSPFAVSNHVAKRATRLFSAPSLPEIEPMSKRIFFVRHGEVINPGGDRPVFYGAMDVDLSELGKAEAKAAKEASKPREPIG